jgi:hypothetical protein
MKLGDVQGRFEGHLLGDLEVKGKGIISVFSVHERSARGLAVGLG